MKKLFILLAAVVLTAMSANVYAQGSGVAPQIGSAHSYWVNANTEGTEQESGVGSNYRWWVSSNTEDLKVAMAAETDFSVENGTYNGTGAEDNYTIKLIWKPVSAGKTYYLVVEETNGDGCKNLKAVAVQPVNAFDVIFAAVNESNEDKDNPERCAPDIALTASGTTITYNYGSDEYIYKISSVGLHSDWAFDYAFVNSLGKATPTIEYSTDGTTYTSTAISGDKTVTPTSGNATIFFKVKVDNGDTATPATSEEGLSGQSMVLTLTNISDGNNDPAHIYMSNGSTEFTGDVEQTQTVKARPATSNIGFN